MARSCVGVDIGTSAIKLVETKRKGRSLVVTSIAGAKTPDKSVVKGQVVEVNAIAEVIKELLKANGMTSRGAAIGLTHSEVVVKTTKFPLMSSKELAQAVEFELGDLVTFPFSDPKELSYSFDVSAKDADEQEIVFTACRRELFQPYLAVLKAAGLDPLVVDIQSFAFSRVIDQPDKRICYVDLGHHQTSIYVETSGRMRVYRILPIGSYHLETGIMEAFEVSAKQAREMKHSQTIDYLLSEGSGSKSALRSLIQQFTGGVLQTLDYLRMQERASSFPEVLDQVVLTGGGSHLQGFAELLQTDLELDVSLLDPFSTLSVAADFAIPDDPASYGSAAGLAVRGMLE